MVHSGQKRNVLKKKKLAWNCKERDNLGGNNTKSPQKRKGATEQVSTN